MKICYKLKKMLFNNIKHRDNLLTAEAEVAKEVKEGEAVAVQLGVQQTLWES